MSSAQSPIPRYATPEEEYTALSPKQKKAIDKNDAQIFVGLEMHEGWSAFNPMFLFRCRVCKRPVKCHAHGHEGKEYLYCPHCPERKDAYHHFSGSRKEIEAAMAYL